MNLLKILNNKYKPDDFLRQSNRFLNVVVSGYSKDIYDLVRNVLFRLETLDKIGIRLYLIDDFSRESVEFFHEFVGRFKTEIIVTPNLPYAYKEEVDYIFLQYKNKQKDYISGFDLTEGAKTLKNFHNKSIYIIDFDTLGNSSYYALGKIYSPLISKKKLENNTISSNYQMGNLFERLNNTKEVSKGNTKKNKKSSVYNIIYPDGFLDLMALKKIEKDVLGKNDFLLNSKVFNLFNLLITDALEIPKTFERVYTNSDEIDTLSGLSLPSKQEYCLGKGVSFHYLDDFLSVTEGVNLLYQTDFSTLSQEMKKNYLLQIIELYQKSIEFNKSLLNTYIGGFSNLKNTASFTQEDLLTFKKKKDVLDSYSEDLSNMVSFLTDNKKVSDMVCCDLLEVLKQFRERA